MEIIYKKPSELTPYKNNPRDNDGAVDYVMRSIDSFGFKVPIVIDADGVVVCGHTKLEAAAIILGGSPSLESLVF